jgi:ABC-type multidrug transport system permease subunit
MSNITAAAAIAWKDFSIWRRRPVAIATTLIPTIMYVLVVYYISIDVGTPPIAVVASGHSAADRQLVSILRSDGGFRATVLSPRAASEALADMSVAAVVTVPARVAGPTAASAIRIRMNDLNADIANDLRRSLALSITTYEAAHGWPPPVDVGERERYAAKTSLAQFRLLPGLILILSIAGIVNTGLATCQEFEGKTFKELVLAPASTAALVLGKILGGWLTTLLIAAFIWLLGLTTGLIAPAAQYLPAALAMSALVGLAACCLGVAMGAGLRQFQLVTSLSVMVALYLFFAAGGVSVFGFLPPTLQQLATFDPLYYACRALIETVLVGSTSGYWRDAAVMIAFAGGAATLSTAVMRRRVVA